MKGAFTVLVHIGEEILGSFSSVVLIGSIISVLSVLPQDTQEYSEEMPPRFVWTYMARQQREATGDSISFCNPVAISTL